MGDAKAPDGALDATEPERQKTFGSATIELSVPHTSRTTRLLGATPKVSRGGKEGERYHVCSAFGDARERVSRRIQRFFEELFALDHKGR